MREKIREILRTSYTGTVMNEQEATERILVLFRGDKEVMEEQYLKDNYRFVYDKYFNTHKVEKVFNFDIDLTKLNDNESVMYGDGETFHFKMTKFNK